MPTARTSPKELQHAHNPVRPFFANPEGCTHTVNSCEYNKAEVFTSSGADVLACSALPHCNQRTAQHAPLLSCLISKILLPAVS
eukprot:1155848-Pelagomonas_calceolata.AAC.1